LKTILVVDDEAKIVQLARDYLEASGFTVSSSLRGQEALAIVRRDKPDLVILDLGLPDLDGLDVARALRRDSSIPIVMLTARGAESDKLVGLELGADDYLTKPFSPKELVARVRAVLRRTEAAARPGEVLRSGEVSLDTAKMRLTRAGQPIDVTASEFQILAALVREPGRVLTRAQLLDALHGTAFESYERAIDAHIKNLRRKLEPDPHRPQFILTVYGVGYRFRDESGL
jgi:two-component system alkaline phosphatase synthesis response regulator PhoP